MAMKSDSTTGTAGGHAGAEHAPHDGGTGGRSASKMDLVRLILRRIPGPLLGLILVCIVFSVLSPYFLTSRNLVNIFSQVSVIGIMAVGAALVIIIGGIDLSVGAVVALSLMINAWLYRDFGMPFLASSLVGIGVGALIGLLNGILSTYARIQPFVATLATMSAYSGLAMFETNGGPITGFPPGFTALATTRFAGIPLESLLMVAIYLCSPHRNREA